MLFIKTQRTERISWLVLSSRSSEWTEMNFLWGCWFLSIRYWHWETFCSLVLWQLASEDPCLCNGKSFIFRLYWMTVACNISHPVGSNIQHCITAETCRLNRTLDILSSPVSVDISVTAFYSITLECQNSIILWLFGKSFYPSYH